MYQPLWEYLNTTDVPKLLWTLARALRDWGEEAQRVMVGLPPYWENLLGPVLGYEGSLAAPWRDILLLADGEAAGPEEANAILLHLKRREEEVLRVLADLFPDSPEGGFALERLNEKNPAPGGLVRPSLGR